MSDPVFYLRMPAGFGPNAAIRDDLLLGLKHLIALEDDVLAGLVAALQSEQGFMDRKRLFSIVSDFQNEENEASNIAGSIWDLSARRRAFDLDAEDVLRQIRRFQEHDESDHAVQFSPEELARIRAWIPKFIGPFDALERQFKASVLRDRTSQVLDRIEMTCDIRPLFDQEKQKIHGAIPITTLRVVATGVDGIPNSMEAVLSNRDVDQLLEATKAAKTKLDAISKLLGQMNIATLSDSR